MKVLAVTSELFPLIKTGGLADVAGALPPVLAAQGVATRTLLPGYPAVMARMKKGQALHRYATLFGGAAAILKTEISGLDLLILDAPHLFKRDGGPYGGPTGDEWPDNWRRFAALSRAGCDVANGVAAGYRPDLVHAHDWQAALTLAYLRHSEDHALPTVMTVHNLAFQGRFGAAIFPELGLPDEAMSLDGVEYYGGVGFLKAGLQAASAITTVSPTYAQEIMTAEFGMGLDGLINRRAADLHGIVNGIDLDIWNPGNDPHLAATYSTAGLKARQVNRKALEARFALETDSSPLLCVISRLTWQKGMDILASRIDGIVAAGARLAVLGTGDQALEGMLLAAAARHGGRVGVIVGYDEALSHLLQGGSDAILIPSRFEPCGLTQLYGLRYGCVPVVARTGGLADTIVDANEAAISAKAATGIKFSPDNGDAFLHAIRRTVTLYRERLIWSSMQRQGMKADLSWAKSAEKYTRLYKSLIGSKQAR